MNLREGKNARKGYTEVLAGLKKNRDNIPVLATLKERRPAPGRVRTAIKLLRKLLFPGYYGDEEPDPATLIAHIEELDRCLCEQLALVVEDERAREISERFMEQLPEVQRILAKDIDAIYHGDPAARSHAEVIAAYPTFQAIMIHRLAHVLWLEKVSLIPRIMSEYAHELTGIDIHPGAQIGESFCIDHGTGVVIGETSIIGEHVKVYQGVTIGALSLEDGRELANTKRHPTIEDHVTLYANCSILGGETVIGAYSVIGGGAFVTESVPPCTKVVVEASKLDLRQISDD